MSENFETAGLSDGSRILVEVSASDSGKSQVAVQLLRKNGSSEIVLLPYPSAGLSGGRIILSPSERFAVLSTYSGQSEEAFELFEIANGLTKVGGLGYQFGEYASFCFSPDESLLVMALPFMCSEWWQPWDDGEAEPDGSERLAFAFGQLHVHDVTNGKSSVHELRISAPEGWQPERTDYDPDLRPVFHSEHALQLAMPWAPVVIPIPVPDVVVLRCG